MSLHIIYHFITRSIDSWKKGMIHWAWFSLSLSLFSHFHPSYRTRLSLPRTHIHMTYARAGYRKSSILFVIFNFTLWRHNLANVRHNFMLSHIHNLIIYKKYTLRYVYWDHTNTSQGYIDIRFFIFFLLFFSEFSPRQAPRDATFSDLTRF